MIVIYKKGDQLLSKRTVRTADKLGISRLRVGDDVVVNGTDYIVDSIRTTTMSSEDPNYIVQVI